MYPRNLKYVPGQRVRINSQATESVPDYVGMFGTIGVGGVSTRHYFNGEYFVTVHLPTGAFVTLRLPERCLDEAQPDMKL
jgi:hypothetical protein